jgi:hypothetical protein
MQGGFVRHNSEKGPPKLILAKFGFIWFRGFSEIYINVIVLNKNMSNLHNLYKLADRNISQKTWNIC